MHRSASLSSVWVVIIYHSGRLFPHRLFHLFILLQRSYLEQCSVLVTVMTRVDSVLNTSNRHRLSRRQTNNTQIKSLAWGWRARAVTRNLFWGCFTPISFALSFLSFSSFCPDLKWPLKSSQKIWGSAVSFSPRRSENGISPCPEKRCHFIFAHNSAKC